jgi:hypothetical protein
MRLIAFAGIAFTFAALAGLACSSFTADSSPGATDAESDGPSSGDAGAPSDAAEAAAPRNLLRNGDFSLGCATWGAFNSTASAITPGRDGGRACRTCTNQAPSGLFSITQTMLRPPALGQTYDGEIWVRGVAAASGSTGSTGGSVGYVAAAALSTHLDGGSTNQEYNDSPQMLTADWQQVAVSLPVTAAADSLDFYVYLERDGGTDSGVCFDVDDATLFATPTP